MIEQTSTPIMQNLFDHFLELNIVDVFSLFTIFAGWFIDRHHKFLYKEVSLSGGKYHFKVRQKNLNTADLTTIVSNLYFGGGTIPGELRKEIFQITDTGGIKLDSNE